MNSLKHLRQSCEALPLQLCLQWKDILLRYQHILSVRPVKLPPHSPHHRNDALPNRQVRSGREDDFTGTLDAKHARELYRRRFPAPREPF